MENKIDIGVFNRPFVVFCVCVLAGYLGKLQWNVQDIVAIVKEVSYMAGFYMGAKEVGNIIKTIKYPPTATPEKAQINIVSQGE